MHVGPWAPLILVGKLFLVLMMTTDGKFSPNKLNLAATGESNWSRFNHVLSCNACTTDNCRPDRKIDIYIGVTSFWIFSRFIWRRPADASSMVSSKHAEMMTQIKSRRISSTCGAASHPFLCGCLTGLLILLTVRRVHF